MQRASCRNQSGGWPLSNGGLYRGCTRPAIRSHGVDKGGDGGTGCLAETGKGGKSRIRGAGCQVQGLRYFYRQTRRFKHYSRYFMRAWVANIFDLRPLCDARTNFVVRRRVFPHREARGCNIHERVYVIVIEANPLS